MTDGKWLLDGIIPGPIIRYRQRLPPGFSKPALNMTDTRPSTTEAVRAILQQTLSLGPRAASLTADSRLLGAIPELDSMAVVNVLTAVEERFGVTVEDDEIDAQTFASFGALVAFVDSKIQA
jgi:acyl carrier protein